MIADVAAGVSSPVPGRAPLAASVERLRRAGVAAPLLAVDPAGPGWHGLADVDRSLDGFLAQGAVQSPGAPDYVAASIASMVAGAVVDAGLPLLLFERRLPSLEGIDLAIRPAADELWAEQVAIHQSGVFMLPDDKAASHPDATVVPDLGHLHQRFVDGLVATVTPWFDALRARAPFGRIGMWGLTADQFTAAAIETAQQCGEDPALAWDEASLLVDRLARRVPQLRARPRPFPVDTGSTSHLFQVKGTCCLWFKCEPDADPAGEGYCVSCPKRSDQDRHPRLVAYLDELTA